MKGRNNKNISSNKILIKKLKLEGRANDYNIEKILSFKKPKPLTINPKLAGNKTNNEEENKNQAYNEALKLIQQFNNKFKNNIINYNAKKEQNNNFLKGYKKCKNLKRKTKEIQNIERRNFIFGQLLNLYDKKGLKIPSEFFYTDIYKDSGLLIVKRGKMDEYFEEEIIKKGESKKSQKTIHFLNKLSHAVDKVFRKRIMNKNIGKSNTSNENESIDDIIPKKRDKYAYFNFFEKVNANIKDISTQEKEIKKLKELISQEEKENNIFNNKNNNSNFDNINSKINIENYNNFDNKGKLNDIKIDETINNSNSFNNNELYTSSTIAPKNNSIFNVKTRNKLLSDNNSNLINSTSFNEDNNIVIQNNSNTKNNFNDNKNNSVQNIEPETINLRLTPGQKKVKRSSMIKFNTLHRKKIVPPIFLNRAKNRRKSFLPTFFFAHLNTSESIHSHKSDKMNLNKDQKNISIRKNNSQPNIIENKKPIKEIYEKILNYQFHHPFKRLHNNETIDDIYKNFYGEKLKKFGKNNPKELFKNYFDIKGNILDNENNYNIFSKYKELLPNIMQNKIRINKEQNKQLKEQPLNYIKSLYYKKYIEFMDKND